MNTAERSAILDRLAAGQLSVSEAMALLDAAAAPAPVAALKEEAKAAPEAAAEIPVEELKADEAIAISFPEEQIVMDKPAANGEAAEGQPRWLKIRVRDTASGRNKAVVTLPLGLVTFGLGIARHFAPDMHDLDTNELLAVLKSQQRGMLIEVQDEEDDEQVQIFVE